MLVDVTLHSPNTTQKAYYDDVTNALRTYRIYPNDGYVLRDNKGDWDETDPFTGEVIAHYEAYYKGSTSVGANYDFEANPREINAVLETLVPADQIFGGSEVIE